MSRLDPKLLPYSSTRSVPLALRCSGSRIHCGGLSLAKVDEIRSDSGTAICGKLGALAKFLKIHCHLAILITDIS